MDDSAMGLAKAGSDLLPPSCLCVGLTTKRGELAEERAHAPLLHKDLLPNSNVAVLRELLEPSHGEFAPQNIPKITWHCVGVVTRRSAKPFTAVQFCSVPPMVGMSDGRSQAS